jgi:hypothetical protein
MVALGRVTEYVVRVLNGFSIALTALVQV